MNGSPHRRLLAQSPPSRPGPAHASSAPVRKDEGPGQHFPADDSATLVRPHAGPTAVELRNLLASDDDAMRQLRRSGLFVANGSHPAKSPVGATFSASMPLLRSFGFLPFALYKYAAPMGLKKAPLPPNSMAVHGPLPQERENYTLRLRQSGAPRLVAARDAVFPLPAGEGQGEGEGGLQLPGSWRFAWRGALYPFAQSSRVHRQFAGALACGVPL